MKQNQILEEILIKKTQDISQYITGNSAITKVQQQKILPKILPINFCHFPSPF